MITKEEFEHLIKLAYRDFDKDCLKRNYERGIISNIRCPACNKLPERIGEVSSVSEHPVIIVNHSYYGTCRVYSWMVAVLPYDSGMKSNTVLQGKGLI